MTIDGFARLAMATFSQPAAVARAIIAMRLPREAAWLGLALVTVLSVLLVGLMNALVPPPEGAALIEVTPLTYALILGGSLVITIFALHLTGQMLGGNGELLDLLALVVWLQMLMLGLQVVQAAIVLLAPLLGGLFMIVTVALSLWVLVNFVNEAHGFDSLGRAVLTLVAALIGVGVGLSVLLGLIGAGVTGGQF